MLGARNTVRPIKSVEFTSTVPFHFLSLIPDILAGTNVMRPSNIELSWRGNLDGLMDMNIPGCKFCYLSLLHCAHPTTNSSMPQPSQTSVAIAAPLQDSNLPKLSQYPVDDLEVLRTWETREEEWKITSSSIANGRAKTCVSPYTYFPKTGRAVTITAEGIRYAHLCGLTRSSLV